MALPPLEVGPVKHSEMPLKLMGNVIAVHVKQLA